MSMTKRVKQWAEFARTRTYQVCGCTWQDAFDSKMIMKRPHKPIDNPLNNCNDSVTLAGGERKKRVHFHHTEYPGSARALAWTVCNTLKDSLQRLHPFPDDKSPQKIMENILSHVRQLRSVSQRSNHWDKDTRRKLSVTMDYPKIKDNNVHSSNTSVRWFSSGGGTPGEVTPKDDCGDHVVAINTNEIALPGDEWKKRVYFHHTGYPGGATWTLAWELHEKDPTIVMKKAVYNALKGNLQRHCTMQRLHLFPDDKIPEEILKNISNQIRQLRPVPQRLDHIDKETLEKFPAIMDYPKDYVLR